MIKGFFVGSRKLKMQVDVSDCTVNDINATTRFKITMNERYVTIKSRPIISVNNTIVSTTLEKLLISIIDNSDWIKAMTIYYNATKIDMLTSRFFDITETRRPLESYANRNIYLASLEVSGVDKETLVNCPEINIDDYVLQITHTYVINYHSFMRMLVTVYNKLENEKAPVDVDDDIEDHDNYFKAYSNTKFTDASLKKLLEMSGNDHSNED